MSQLHEPSRRAQIRGMIELVRSNDPVLLSFLQALLKDAEIPSDILDSHMGILEGSIGAIRRRLVTTRDYALDARRVIKESGYGHELRPWSDTPE